MVQLLIAAFVLASCASSQTTAVSEPRQVAPLQAPVSLSSTDPTPATNTVIGPTLDIGAEPVPVKFIREEVSFSENPEPVTFDEIWGYVQAGEESALDPTWPVSDIALFSAGISNTGKLKAVPKRSGLANYPGRVHLVVAELGNYALSHFCLSPEYPIRADLISQIAEAAIPFDGVQIDFEAILTEDTDNFISFLRAIKTRIGQKTLSVALPARTKKIVEAYDYERIATVVDRIIIMAYDEHWSGSQPGSVASLQWCERVANYALQVIGNKKLVIGLPFYGRAWGETNPSRAYRYSSLSKLMEEKGIQETHRLDGSVFFEYSELIKVQVFYEDHRSVHQRAELYHTQGVNHIAFWRIGQEDTRIWEFLYLRAE